MRRASLFFAVSTVAVAATISTPLQQADARPGAALDAPTAAGATLDQAIEARLASTKVTPAAGCSDEAFLRRVCFDLTGGPPTVERARAFHDDRAPDKRAKLVRELLDSQAFSTWWGRALLETVTNGGRADEEDGWNGRQLVEHLAGELEKRRGLDVIVKELLAVEGNRGERPAVEWLLRWEVDPAKLAGSIGRDLLGVSIACAQCHDHPTEPWTQDDFWSLAAFFARTRYFETDDELEGITEHRRTRRSMSMPRDDEEQEKPGERKPDRRFSPRFLDRSSPAATEEPRASLAARVVASPLFARHLVDRVWERLLGRPLDATGGDDGPATDPTVLDALAARLRASSFDLRDLVSTIVSTRAYARKGAPRPLTHDQLRTALIVATGVGEDEDPRDDEEYEDYLMNPEEREDDEEAMEDSMMDGASGATAIDPRLIPVEGDTDTPVLLGRANTKARFLALLNGSYVREAVESGARKLVLLHGGDAGAPHVEHAFLALLSRRPTEAERAAALSALAEAGGRRRGVEDLLWSIINSAEFGAVW